MSFPGLLAWAAISTGLYLVWAPLGILFAVVMYRPLVDYP